MIKLLDMSNLALGLGPPWRAASAQFAPAPIPSGGARCSQISANGPIRSNGELSENEERQRAMYRGFE